MRKKRYYCFNCRTTTLAEKEPAQHCPSCGSRWSDLPRFGDADDDSKWSVLEYDSLTGWSLTGILNHNQLDYE